MNLGLETTPFSRRGSYVAISYLSDLPENFRGKENREGLYLRTVHDGPPNDLIARLTPTMNDKEVPYRYIAMEAELVISCGYSANGEIKICFGEGNSLLIQGRGDHMCLRLEGHGNGDRYTFVNRILRAGKDFYVLNCFKNSFNFGTEKFRYEEGQKSAAPDFQSFYRRTPVVPERYETAHETAAYVSLGPVS